MPGSGAAGLVAGVAMQLGWERLPFLPALWLALAAASIAFLRAAPGRVRLRMIAGACAGIAAGMWLAAAAAATSLQARLPPAAMSRDVVVAGLVQSPRLRADGSSWFLLAAPSLPWCGCPGRLLVSLYDPLPVADGERWRLQLRLRPPHAGANPGVRDGESFLYGAGIVATGYVRVHAGNRRLEPAQPLARWRAQVVSALAPLHGAGAGDLATHEHERFARAVLPALLLDDRSLLAPHHWRLLADTGTAHLVAISGLHLGILWLLLFLLLGLATRRRPAGLRQRLLPVLAALLVAGFYAALAGMPLPVLRALLMLALASACLLASARVPAWRVWLSCAALVLAMDPRAVHDAGWWLSFGSVAAILLLLDLQRRDAAGPGIVAALAIAVRAQWWLGWLVAPLTVALFGAASTSSVLANLVAVPLVNLLVLPLALCAALLAPPAPALADIPLEAACALLGLLWRVLAWLDGIAWLAPVAWHGATPAALVALLLAVLALLAGPRRAALPLAAALVLLAWPQAPPVAPGTARVTVLDVGQGNAVLVQGAHTAWLFDAGPAWGEDSDAGTRIVVPALRALGVRRLDLLLLSHADSDHAGGAGAVIAAFRPRLVVAGTPVEGVPALACDRDRRLRADGLSLRLFASPATGSDNERSCVAHVTAGGRSLLLPGDIPARRELELAARWRGELHAGLLLASHHGSRSGNSETWLATVAPGQLVFSRGRYNRHGHPHPAVRAAARRHGIAPHDTATGGALQWTLGGGAVAPPLSWRRERRRFWHQPLPP